MIQVEWVVEGCICQVTMPPVVTDDMLKDYDQKVIALFDQASAPVTMVVDVSPMDKIPGISHWTALKMLRHPHMGMTLLTGLNGKPVLRFFAGTVSQLASAPVKTFDTYDQALAYAHKMKV